MTPPSCTAAMAFVSLSFYTTTPTVCAFSSPPTSFLKSNHDDTNYIARGTMTAPSTFTFTTVSPPAPCLSMSSSEEGGGGSADASGRKRRKRKDGKNLASIRAETKGDDDDVAIPTPVETTAAPAAAAPVELKVMDVRDIVSGAAAPSTNRQTTQEEDDDDDEYEYYDDDEEEDDDDDEYEETDEYEYYFTDEDGREVVVDDSFGTSLAGGGTGLLADARKIRETQSPALTASEGGGDGTGGLREVGIDALSKIVTADFFLVVALLLWFLVGVFCSKVLGNDGVYLQFAGLFEPVVQPALGILILGALLTGVLKEKEVEDE